jgi:RNA polymerase sigma-70 factor, ECF subfamily
MDEMTDDRPTLPKDAPKLSASELIRTHGRSVLGMCLGCVRNRHDAEDLMQEVFLKAIRRLDSLKDSAKARAWILQIARRTCVDHHRRQRSTQPLDEALHAPSVQPEEEQAEWILQAVSKLPEEYAHTIALYYLDGRSCADTAASLGLTETAVRQRLVRARTMLHDLLRED